ncbi:probable serine/threonine-protein kinase DDB_G0282963 [Aphis gossypii]|uniref:probable serine/threonine-protein kinase DDB_G0282963 n=1 Tax=Aphis gossypii TaxID=80765 RepID=UPI002159104D|nr:probable serine/threonine-protein kinase DDB_G0282963 [Aphis gossypii]
MLFALMLASALATSAVLGRVPGPIPSQATFVEEERIQGLTDRTEKFEEVDDRSSNLKYVMAIQSSTIWSDIKKRSVTINTDQRLDNSVAEKSPNDMSDQELAKLKQACHDGLKCVAVEQLLVLFQAREQLSDGNTLVRMAITKITEVLSEYTKEYHEDVYEYKTVTQSDNSSKVYDSVTTIVQDNKELCQIDGTPTTVKNEDLPKNSDGSGGDTQSPIVVNNNTTVNFNKIENLNLNEGTVNNAQVNIETPPVVNTVDVTISSDRPIDNELENRSPAVDADRQPNARTTAETSAQTAGDESVVKPVENDAGHELALRNRDRDTPDQDRQQLMITDGPESVPADTDNSAGRRGARRPRPVVTGEKDGVTRAVESVTNNTASVSNVDGGNSDSSEYADKTAADVNRNTASVKNSHAGGGSGENDSDSDIVSAGNHNQEDIKKGLVEDGYFNNGNMKVKNFDKSNRNKGTIKDCNANKGIINVGTVNNGPVNYGESKTFTNGGTMAKFNDFDIQKYATSIDKMYSAILEKLSKKN